MHLSYMNKMARLIYFILLFLYLSLTNVVAKNLNVFSFTEEELLLLKTKKVRGANSKTKYSLGKNVNGNYLKAVSNNAASGIGKDIKINLSKTPYINITWKIEEDLPGIIENSKKGHDYAARVFVVKKTGVTPLSNRAMNYVFSSNNSVGDNWPSPYTKKSIDYVLSTTKENLNEWVSVKVNVKKHFKEFHNLDVKELSGVAIMTDTDNSKLKAVSYYQNIYFSSE